MEIQYGQVTRTTDFNFNILWKSLYSGSARYEMFTSETLTADKTEDIKEFQGERHNKCKGCHHFVTTGQTIHMVILNINATQTTSDTEGAFILRRSHQYKPFH